MAKAATKSTNATTETFKLPQYLRLAKGVMWYDTEGENASGARLFAATTKLVGRGKVREDSKLKPTGNQPKIPSDKNNNNNFLDYGYVDVPAEEVQWYIDTTKIPTEKQSRLVLAYKHKILVEADPKNPPKSVDNQEQAKDFQHNRKGDLVFAGKNSEIFTRLQNLKFKDLKDFIISCPRTESAKNNLIDMYHYEVKGFNKLSRARQEVLQLIRDKLKEWGPTISAIRVNEDK